MCDPAPITDRATAHKINPLVSSLSTADTLDNISGLVDDLAYFLSAVANQAAGEEAHFGRLYMLFGAIAGALAYEAQQPQPNQA